MGEGNLPLEGGGEEEEAEEKEKEEEERAFHQNLATPPDGVGNKHYRSCLKRLPRGLPHPPVPLPVTDLPFQK